MSTTGQVLLWSWMEEEHSYDAIVVALEQL